VPSQIVLVHDDPEFSLQISDALQAEGLSVTAFADPMDALALMDQPNSFLLLISRIQFSHGKPNGVALSRLIKYRRAVKVLFVTRQENQVHIDDGDEFLATPVSAQEVALAAKRLIG
jgi:DNA-binding response OmpR family regulator